MSRHVRGFLFVDYVRIIRAHKQIAWEEHLQEEDLPWLSQQIELHEWYPMDSYERMGLAILDNIAGGDMELIHRWGRETVDLLHESQPYLIADGDPSETFNRFDVLRQTLFDFPAVQSRFIRDGKVSILIDYKMSARAEEAACHQSLGFIERLLELAGAENIQVGLARRSWSGDGDTVMEVAWSPKW